MKKEMLINVLQPEEIRIAIVEDNVLEELYVERTSHESYVGNIYKGRIVNIEPSIQAVFVDFGVGRNGFLHVSDVEPAYYRHLSEPSGRRDAGRGSRDDGRGGDRGRRGGSGGGNGGGNGGRSNNNRRGGRDEGRDQERTLRHQEQLDRDLDEMLLEPAIDPTEHISIINEPIERIEQIEPTAIVSHEPITPSFETGVTRLEPASSSEEMPFTESPRFDTAPPQQSAPASEVDEKVASSEAEVEIEGESDEKPAKGKRTRAGRTKRGRSRKATTDSADEPAASSDDAPKLMDSTEHRTEGNDGPRGPSLPKDDFSDDMLSFSMAPRVSTPVEPAATKIETPRIVESAPIEKMPEQHAPSHDSLFDDEVPIPDEEQQEIADLDREQAEVVDHGDEGVTMIDFQEPDDEGFDEIPPRNNNDRGGRGGRRDDRRGPPSGRQSRGDRRGPGGRPGALGRPKPLIQDIFKRGQEVIVQVIKEGIGTKGPTLSTYISIAGRYLVLMPGLNRIGVSRKIIDEDSRRRLRDILSDLHPPKGLGFIIRTAGQDRNKKELQGDLAYLSRLYQVVARRIQKIKAPAEVYQESDMITRTIRDIFSNDIDTIWVDEPQAYEAAKEFLTIVMPRYAHRIKFWESSEPMFHKYGIEQEIHRIQQRHVPLPMGGSIVIDQAEALVAIDVNSGNFRADNNAEETAYQMNLQAAKEIARQLRLRDLGGVIANDFIDMRDEKHRRGVEKALRDAIRRDRARTKILRMSQFGIIEMTRQRIRPSLKRSVYHDCNHCHGTGQVKTIESMSIEVMRMMQLAVHRDHMQRIEVRVHDDVAQYLLNRKRKEIVDLEEKSSKPIVVRGVGNEISLEFLEFICFDSNNNEVKFQPFEENRPQQNRGRGRHRN